MALITDLENQPPVGGTQTVKRIPSYMQPTKTSTRKAGTIEEGLGASVLKQKDGNQVQPVPLKPILKVKGSGVKATLENEGKENKIIKSGIPVLKKSTLIKPKNKISVHSSDGSGVLVLQKSTPKQPQEKTLGKLFTDGGLEDILIKVLEMMVPKDMAKCLNVCKNTNEVMVTTSSIQIRLRYHLYGLRTSPDWNEYTFKKDTSLQTIDRIISLHRQRTWFTVAPNKMGRRSIRGVQLVCCRGRIMVVVNPTRGWAVVENFTLSSWHTRLAPQAKIELCAKDRVVVEYVLNYDPESTTAVLSARFFDIPTGTGQGMGPIQHVQARFHSISLHLPSYPGREFESYQLRLYPGGLAAVLLHGHTCWRGCDRTPAGASSIRIVVFDWRRGWVLGVIQVPKKSVRILDFQFLSNTRIACTSMRSYSINGRLVPCIDLYDVPTNPKTPIARDIFVHQLPDIPHVASFQLPPLADRHLGCIWRADVDRTCVSDFVLRVGQPHESTAIFDQLVTFRLNGGFDDKTMAIEGVVSIPRLEELLSRESQAKRISETDPLRISWNHWSSAVSLQRTDPSISLPEPKSTLVARLGRSSRDASQAVMVIRDYNQQLLHAPSGHMTKVLGHSQTGLDDSHSFELFRVVNETRSLDSLLFLGGSLNFGPGYRTRTIDMGVYSPATERSKIHWYENMIWIISDVGDGIVSIDPYLLQVQGTDRSIV